MTRQILMLSGLLGGFLLVACDPAEPGGPAQSGCEGAKCDEIGDEAPTSQLEVVQWGGRQEFPAELDVAVTTDADADFCEFYVDALGHGEFSSGGATTHWYEATLLVGEHEGLLLGAGMYAAFVDADGEEREILSLGDESEDGSWNLGLLEYQTSSREDRDVKAFAFFIDVERDDGEVVRLWQSADGANFSPDDVFVEPMRSDSLGDGTISWANDDAPVFEQRRACAR